MLSITLCFSRYKVTKFASQRENPMGQFKKMADNYMALNCHADGGVLNKRITDNSDISLFIYYLSEFL